MFALISLGLVGSALALLCPQDTYKARNAFEVFTQQDGWDIQFWNHRGFTFIGSSTPTATGSTPLVLAAGSTFAATTAFNNIASIDDLKNNGDEYFFVNGDVTATGGISSSCLFTIGSSKQICVQRNGNWSFVASGFGFINSGSASGTSFTFGVRRFFDVATKSIRLDFTGVNIGGFGVTRAGGAPLSTLNLPAAAWDFDAGLTFNSPPTGNTTTITQLIVVRGRGNLASDLAGFQSTASTLQASFTDCVYDEWITSSSVTGSKPYAVPSGDANNFKAKFQRTNFQVTPTPSGNAAAQWSPVLTEIGNFTALTLSTGVTLVGTGANGTTDVFQLTIAAIAPGANVTVEFTSRVFNCTETGTPYLFDTPVVAPAVNTIQVAGVVADLYIARESKLTFIVRDLRPFDLNDLPIAAGCEVPFKYSVDVRNDGPSCVENLDLESVIDEPVDRNGAPAVVVSSPAITATRIFPGKLRDGAPVEISINALKTAPNVQFVNRSITLVGPLNGGVSSSFHPLPFFDFFRRESKLDDRDINLLGQTYEISRYGDVQVKFSWLDQSVVAGEFGASSTDPNLRGKLSVKNAGCVDVTDVQVQLKIDQPRGSWYFDVNGVGASNVAQRTAVIERRIVVGNLEAGEAREFDIDFAVCQLTKASTAGLNVAAWLLRDGDVTHSGELSQYERNLPSNDFEAPAESTTNRFDRVVPVRPFDDKTDDVATISLSALLAVELVCDAPKLVSTTNFAHDSSSSSDVHDVDVVKVTRCKVTVDNTGASDVPVKVNIDWVLPSSTRLARWATPTEQDSELNQFVIANGGGVWATLAKSKADGPVFNKCPARSGRTQTLELDFASTRPGELQLVARVDKSASVAAFDPSSTFGSARTIKV